MFSFCPYCAAKVPPHEKEFKCQNCQIWTHYASFPTASIVAIVGNEMLLSVRGIEPGKGTLDIVGGFLKQGEDPVDGAIREFKEETGGEIDRENLKFLMCGIGRYIYQNENIYTLNMTYFIILDEKPVLKASDDVAELKWAPIDGEYDFAFPYLFEIQAEVKRVV